MASTRKAAALGLDMTSGTLRKLLDDKVEIGFDWDAVAAHLDARGCAVLPRLLTPAACRELAALYGDDRCFRSRVIMSRHGFGRGEYKYFAYPLPERVAELRTALYPQLAPIANEWSRRLGGDRRYPATLEAFLQGCHA